MGYYYALSAVFSYQWRLLIGRFSSFSIFFAPIPTFAVIMWVARGSGDPQVVTYLLLGGWLTVTWYNMVFRTGYSLNDEIWDGTVPFDLASRTPLILILLGKALAVVAFSGIVGGLAAVLILLAAPQDSLRLLDSPQLLFSLALAFLGLIVVAFSFAPFMVLGGGRAGFFNAIMPAGAVFSGFLFPISLFPDVIEVILRLLPTVWAMDAVRMSLVGESLTRGMVTAWVLTIALSVAWFVVIYFMFRKVEERVRITGILNIG